MCKGPKVVGSKVHPGSWTTGRRRKALTRLGRPQRALRPCGDIGLSPRIPGKLFSYLAEVWVGGGGVGGTVDSQRMLLELELALSGELWSWR